MIRPVQRPEHAPQLAQHRLVNGAGVDLGPEPVQDAADRTGKLLSGAIAKEKADFSEISAEGRAPGSRQGNNATKKGLLG